jgi:hypothetical protein
MNPGANCYLGLNYANCSTGNTAPPQPSYLGLEHLGPRVDGIDAVVAELKAKGAEFTVESKTDQAGLGIAFRRGSQNVHIELLDGDAA